MSHSFVPHVVFGLDPMWVSTAILCVTYAVIVWDRFNRAIVALIAATVIVFSGALDQAEALKGIDWNTIGLLTGMMILVSISGRSGMFQYVAIWSAQKAKASPAGILLLLQLTTAIVSALLDNVTTVLLVVPVTLAITEELDISPYPFLFAEVFASNIGGTATLIGDPPNILIGSLAGFDFDAFAINLLPIIVVVMAAQALIIHVVWGRGMRATPESRALVMGMSAVGMITDWTLLKQAAAVLCAVLVAFIFARPLRLQPATIALGGAAVLMLLDNWEHRSDKQSQNVHKTFSDVEWITIFFFIGLFVVVHAVDVSGLLRHLANAVVAATGGNLAHAGFAILWASAFLSAIVDNIPFVATMIPLIKSMAGAFGGAGHIEPLWWCLSLGACLGGNGTLVGASANLTVAGLAERKGIAFSFLKYTLYALPMMTVSVAVCQIYVWLRYFWG